MSEWQRLEWTEDWHKQTPFAVWAFIAGSGEQGLSFYALEAGIKFLSTGSLRNILGTLESERLIVKGLATHVDTDKLHPVYRVQSGLSLQIVNDYD